MLGRRSFLIACGIAVGTPATARASLLLATSNRLPTLLSEPLPPQAPVDETHEARVLQIEGWDTPFVSEESARGQVWISVNRSWRTDWR
jgi:hypothetical protein